MRYITDQEVVFNDLFHAESVAEALLEEDYVVMLSKEGDKYVLNYIWVKNGDRNGVVFVDRDDY